MNGLILKGIGGFYTVLGDDGAEYTCKARGRFRKDGVTPLPGDRVDFATDAKGGGYLEEILPRRNALIRPMVANLDKLIIVLSASVPRADLMLADKLIISALLLNVTPVIVINKCDEKDDEIFRQVVDEYSPTGIALISASAVTGEGMDALKSQIAENTCAFAGQSAVGKSSLINALMPELDVAVGDVSEKTDRGRHTTRHAELWRAFGGAVLDTPGFSLFDTTLIEPERLAALYPEMREKAGNCRFPQCLHISEPDCAVKPLLKTGGLSTGRYERYLLLIEELKEKRKHKYD